MMLEWRKLRTKALLALSLGLPLLLVALLTLTFYGRLDTRPELASPHMFWQTAAAFWGVFLGMPLCLLLSTFAVLMERTMWQHLRLQGVHLARLVAVKVMVVWLLNVAIMVALIVMMTIAAWGLGLSRPADGARWPMWFMAAVALLPAIACQVWLTLRVNHFLLAMGCGMTGHFLALFVTRTNWGIYVPWAAHMEFLQVRGAAAVVSPGYGLFAVGSGIVLAAAASWWGGRYLRR